MRLNMLTEQGEKLLIPRPPDFTGSEAYDHQEGCLLLSLTCSVVHCHKAGDLVTGKKVMSLRGTLN